MTSGLIVAFTFVGVALFVGWLAWRISGAYTAHPEIERLIDELEAPVDENVPAFLAELRGWLIAQRDPRIRRTPQGWEIDNVTQAAVDFCAYQAQRAEDEGLQFHSRSLSGRSVH